MGVSDRLKSSHQCVPKLMKAQEPDFVSSAYVWRKSARAGTARAKLPGNLIFASTFEHPNISDRKVYANLGRVKDTKEYEIRYGLEPPPLSETCFKKARLIEILGGFIKAKICCAAYQTALSLICVLQNQNVGTAKPL